MKRNPAELMALVAAELMRGPATIGALCVAMHARPDRSDRVQVYIRPLRAAGRVRICGWVTQQQPIMALQTAPFALPDEPMPPKRVPKRKTGRRLSPEACRRLAAVRKERRQPVPLGPNSVFALGAMWA